MGEAKKEALRVNFDNTLKLEFHGVKVTSDAERLSVDPAKRHVVGGRAKDKTAASVSLMGRFETEILTQPKNLKALINQPGQWVDEVYPCKTGKADQDRSQGGQPCSICDISNGRGSGVKIAVL